MRTNLQFWLVLFFGIPGLLSWAYFRVTKKVLTLEHFARIYFFLVMMMLAVYVVLGAPPIRYYHSHRWKPYVSPYTNWEEKPPPPLTPEQLRELYLRQEQELWKQTREENLTPERPPSFLKIPEQPPKNDPKLAIQAEEVRSAPGSFPTPKTGSGLD